ncbi:hypothetical protein [Peribacillus tepidiphilus]|uniref:hypothetical protein n=1 Tax=Peribacillus tepidiphilus TaxID=2652445 RepID=UPI001290BE42|nr:hypothetical protein [Peribacillus tepidiphilus]
MNTVIIPFLPTHILGIFVKWTQGGQVGAIISVFLKVLIMIIALHLLMLILQLIK